MKRNKSSNRVYYYKQMGTHTQNDTTRFFQEFLFVKLRYRYLFTNEVYVLELELLDI